MDPSTQSSPTTTTTATAPDPARPAPLTLDQKVDVGLSAKAQGNACFTQGDPKRALAHYHTAVLYLSGLDQTGLGSVLGQAPTSAGGTDASSLDETKPEPVPHYKKHLSQVHSNMAACHIKLENYPRAIDAAEKAAKADPSNLKATFRKAQALRLSGSLNQAIGVLEKAIKEHPEERSGFASELASCERALKAKEAQSQSKWKGFLGKNPSVLASDGAVEPTAEAAKATGGDATRE